MLACCLLNAVPVAVAGCIILVSPRSCVGLGQKLFEQRTRKTVVQTLCQCALASYSQASTKACDDHHLWGFQPSGIGTLAGRSLRWRTDVDA